MPPRLNIEPHALCESDLKPRSDAALAIQFAPVDRNDHQIAFEAFLEIKSQSNQLALLPNEESNPVQNGARGETQRKPAPE